MTADEMRRGRSEQRRARAGVSRQLPVASPQLLRALRVLVGAASCFFSAVSRGACFSCRLSSGSRSARRSHRSISVGFYVVGSFLLVAGFFVGNRGPTGSAAKPGTRVCSGSAASAASGGRPPRNGPTHLSTTAVFIVARLRPDRLRRRRRQPLRFLLNVRASKDLDRGSNLMQDRPSKEHMGTLHQRSLLCERARGWVSLSLDGELSEFERALLDAHLGRCAECSVFAADTGAATTLPARGPARAAAAADLASGNPAPHRRLCASRRSCRGRGRRRLGLAGSMTVSSGPRVSAVPRGASDQTSDRLIRIAQRQSLTPAPLIDRGRSVLTLPL